MFYEIEALKDMVQSYKNAINEVENKENVTFELFFNMSETFESIDTDQISKEELLNKFNVVCNDLEKNGYPITKKVYEDIKPYSIGSYRRDLNDKGCEDNDFVIWGETDILFPKELFQGIETVSEYSKKENIHRYCLTFGTRKMWDDGWKILEHNDFTDCKFTELHDNLWQDDPSSIFYTMNIEEMNKINSKIDEFDFRYINYPKIDGSCLVLSSDLIKFGVNVPSCLIYNDDHGVSIMAEKLLGKNYIQFICKNLLKVHARRHPNKRLYVLDEDNQHSFENKKTNSFNKFKQLSQANIETLASSSPNKFYEYSDFKK